MRWLICLALLFASAAATAAVRTTSVEWSHDCMTVPDVGETVGDSLDLDGDGICELLIGFRFYTTAGEFIAGIPEDGTRLYDLRYNMPWGDDQCHMMTATMEDDVVVGQINESAFSNVGACRNVRRGNPNAPGVTN